MNLDGRPAKPRPYPIAPLLACMSPDESAIAVQRRLRCSGSTWHRAVEEGLTESQADRWACAYGRHPSELWPEWFENAPAWTPDPIEAMAS